jgi:transitional endoplasmic reticulum ATPase
MQIGTQPEFIDLAHVAESDMIHTAETSALIATNIFSPLKNTAACRKHRIPLKRGVLLEGRYGTGKSLTARVTAKVATDNGWTFIMLDRAQGLRAAIEFAKNYQPCVIFAEDIDRAADRSDEAVNDLVNMLDGVISKSMEMMVVLTTNFIDKIDTALLRPGRFDAVISIQPPDPETVGRLIRQYGRDLIDASADLGPVGEVIAGQIPATIREVVERAKLSMLVEGRDRISPDDLYFSAVGMKRHLDLLAPKPPERSAGDRLADALADVLGTGASTSTSERIDGIVSQVGKARAQIGNVSRQIEGVERIAQGAAGSAGKAVEIGEKVATRVADLKTAVEAI